ncbi:MAG TPA: dihydroorotase, partial [Acidimicrobiia bacterium]|nr:dihydroorotase [Acidimicrobiia bacterium]
DGTIDVVATDHAPHRDDEKAVSFDLAPRGVIGLETAAAATWGALGDRDLLFDVMSTRPAAILGLGAQGQHLVPGSVANVVVFDPSERWVPASFKSKSANSPYLGREMTGKVVATVHRGRVTHHSVGRS